jgi:hypothetical protein
MGRDNHRYGIGRAAVCPNSGRSRCVSPSACFAVVPVAGAHAFRQWARALLSSVPETLRKDIKIPLSNLLAALEELPSAYKIPVPDLVPRPAFYLLSQVTVSLYLLEHAIWSHTNVTTQSNIDIEAFSRWVEDCGLAVSRDAVRKALKVGFNRSKMDTGLVYGVDVRAKL